MASTARARIHPPPSDKPAVSTTQAEEDLLASIMVSVSASLDAMSSDEEREKAVAAAEKAVAHLQ